MRACLRQLVRARKAGAVFQSQAARNAAHVMFALVPASAPTQLPSTALNRTLLITNVFMSAHQFSPPSYLRKAKDLTLRFHADSRGLPMSVMTQVFCDMSANITISANDPQHKNGAALYYKGTGSIELKDLQDNLVLVLINFFEFDIFDAEILQRPNVYLRVDIRLHTFEYVVTYAYYPFVPLWHIVAASEHDTHDDKYLNNA